MHQLVILGASARAAAASASLAGWAPAAADLFGDRDLTAMAIWTPVECYPAGLEAAAERLPASPWIYTGGLENHPDLVDRIAARRPLLGNSGRVLRAVRDPLRLASCLAAQGLASPACSLSAPDPADNQRWLAKPLRSCGGHGIHWASGAEAAIAQRADPNRYYQRYVPGPAYSASYVAAGGRACLLGVTRQLVGLTWTGARPFAYCGSNGPARLSPQMTTTFRRIGDVLATAFELTGLFGVDTVVAEDVVYVLEVNPRYTASIEVLERGLRRSLLSDHWRACCGGCLPQASPRSPADCCGKVVLYTTRAITISGEFSALLDRLNAGCQWPAGADLPPTGSAIDAGHPLITLRAQACGPRQVRRELRQLAGLVQAAVSSDERPTGL